MTKKEFQKKIDKSEKSSKEMREIGEAYIEGEVLKDLVAAEGWLMKVIEGEDQIEAAYAMRRIAVDILGKETVISNEDYLEIKKELEHADGKMKEELEALLLNSAANKNDYSL